VKLNEGAKPETIAAAEREIGWQLPGDYRAFLARSNGGEGFLGEHYLVLWAVEELAPFNRDFQVQDYAPGLVLFGSDGGNELFGFDTRNDASPIVQVPMIGMELRSARLVARNIDDLLSR
jgi:SMI1/KNR4 family protein SUKH-1